ncbi:hypothetical protein [Pseudomonas tohonis]|nr:hypothetical protein [Pseudomonas tohonis]UXY55363.1 hypothetical protein N9L84_12570 [Pseudomonas tohonis]
MIIFASFHGERRGDLLARAMAAGITSLPRRDFQHAGRVLITFEVGHG